MESNKEKNFASAVVYCYNDADKIGSFVENLDKTLTDNFLKYEIIVVNDASTDNSVEVVKKFAAHKDSMVITVINMSYTHGLESSMNAGVDLSIGDFVYEFDTVDVDYDWNMMMDIYRQSLRGYDVVSACPDRRETLSRKVFYKVFNHYTNFKYPLKSETFRVLSRRAINRVRSITQNPTYRKAAYANCGLAVDFIKYNPTTDNVGPSRASAKSSISYFILYTGLAYRVTLGLAFFMALAAICMAAYAIYSVVYSSTVEGWATTIIFLAFCFAGLFMIMAMAIKYLQTIVFLIFRRKSYIFESIEKLQ